MIADHKEEGPTEDYVSYLATSLENPPPQSSKCYFSGGSLRECVQEIGAPDVPETARLTPLSRTPKRKSASYSKRNPRREKCGDITTQRNITTKWYAASIARMFMRHDLKNALYELLRKKGLMNWQGIDPTNSVNPLRYVPTRTSSDNRNISMWDGTNT